MKSNKLFVADCNTCVYCNLTEDKQNEIYLKTNDKPNHRCLLFNKRIIHNCRKDGYLYPCSECGGWEFISKDTSSLISPYIKEILLNAIKKEYRLQESFNDNHEDKLRELKEFYESLTGEYLDTNTFWTNSKYLE
jgi:hypothetical protein